MKKLQVSDTEGAVAKSRQRKATGSDTEGGGARSKQKKTASSETEGVLTKVRPPPKKRAKMELELLNSGDLEKHKDCGGSILKSEAADDKGKPDTSSENGKTSCSESDASISVPHGLNVASLKSGIQVKFEKKIYICLCMHINFFWHTPKSVFI